MAALSGIRIGTQARAVAAALALGAAALSLAPGQTAFAARHVTSEPGDPDAGAGRPAPTGTGTATRKNINDAPKCTITSPDGHIDFYLPGDLVVRNGHPVTCGGDGQWIPFSGASLPGGSRVLGSGVATQGP